MENPAGRGRIGTSIAGKAKINIHKATNRGYTLIELSVVVLLIGMMLVIAVPRVREAVFSDALKATARRLVGAARELKNEAIREQVDYILHLDLDHPGFWVYSADTTPEKLAEIRKKASPFAEGLKITDFIRPGEEKQTEGNAEIRFHRQGYVDPAVIHLKKNDREFTVVFQPFLNTVTVYEKYVDYTFSEEGQTFGR
ncbi:MAG: type II secretion system GspH family protein [Syntrophobacterales bacterium]|nr:type II secretion system GspH family protein [Syntrophobacterales bacterium]